MESGERIYVPLTITDLKRLKDLALREHKDFFGRNPHLRDNSLIGICLCQGASSHYLNPQVGIKDFDIWHFYEENREINFPNRAHKRIGNGYLGRPIDFLKRVIPRCICSSFPNDSERIIMEYLTKRRDTTTKKLLLKNAIIGLYPDNIFGKILWRGIHIPSKKEFIRGIKTFERHEKRDAMYKVATFLVLQFWGKPSEMADGLGVLLLTWNQAFYRYGSFDFDELERCIRELGNT